MASTHVSCDVLWFLYFFARALVSVSRQQTESQLRHLLLGAQQDAATARNETHSLRKKLAAVQDAMRVMKETTHKHSDKEWEAKVAAAVAAAVEKLTAATASAATSSTAYKELEKQRNDALEDCEHLKKTMRNLTEQLATVSQRDVRLLPFLCVACVMQCVYPLILCCHSHCVACHCREHRNLWLIPSPKKTKH
jgi:hypothetical protein